MRWPNWVKTTHLFYGSKG